MKVTVRGRAVLAVAVALTFSVLLYQDGLILTVLLLLVSLAAGEAVWLRAVTGRPAKWFSISNGDDVAAPRRPFSISKSLYPGETSQDDLYFLKKIGGEAALVSGIPSMEISPNRFTESRITTKVEVNFKTAFAGRYSADAFWLTVTGPLGILSATCPLPAKLIYSVRPRVVSLAMTSAKLLGRGREGETAVDSPGIGTEHHGVREYQTGESYRHINWKASARLGSLMINELKKEAGGAYYLVLEAASPDYFDRDRLAATFLGIANALTERGVRFGVVVHDGNTVKRLKRLDAPLVSLFSASSAALEFVGLDPATLEMELLPASSHALKPIRRLLVDRGPLLLRQIEDFAIAERQTLLQTRSVSKTIMELVEEKSGDPPSIVYVSGLFGSIEPVMELALSMKRTYRTEFVIANPTAPWVAAPDETSACEVYSKSLRKTKALRNAGVDYEVGEPASIVQRVVVSA